MNDITSAGRSELLATIAQLEDRNAALQKTVTCAVRDYSQMLATLTDAQAIGTRQREQIIALKAQLAAMGAPDPSADRTAFLNAHAGCCTAARGMANACFTWNQQFDEIGVILGRKNETLTEAADRVVRERNAAVAGLAAAQVEISKLAREVEAARLNLSAHRMTLQEIRDLTGSVRVVPAEHLDEIDPSGGVKGGGE